ncbi:hypothetical protein H2248_003003 [Termitomyces sp. 'cryptogamus']|nr:hypothetical protein H2248_003003 [Termitomyces sp. 'cryptogamus']
MNANMALSTPELLHLIFSFSTSYSVAIGTQVCKFWSEVAKPVLWRAIDSDAQFEGLLRVLAPWDFHIKFTRPRSPDWPRFLGCSRLVHTLTIDWTNDIMISTLYSVLEFIFESRPASDVFPTLHTLKCIAYEDTRHLSIFFHPGVKRWLIDFVNYESRNDPSMPLISINLVQSLSGLVELEIKRDIIVDDLLSTLIPLKDLLCLRIVVLPYDTASYAVLKTLSMFQTLQEIRSRPGSYPRACRGKHSLPRPFTKGVFPIH